MDLALEPAGAGTGVTGSGQPTTQDQEAELPKGGPEPRATAHTAAFGDGPTIYHPKPQHLTAWGWAWEGSQAIGSQGPVQALRMYSNPDYHSGPWYGAREKLGCLLMEA